MARDDNKFAPNLEPTEIFRGTRQIVRFTTFELACLGSFIFWLRLGSDDLVPTWSCGL